MLPILILQLRSETAAADQEFQAFLTYGQIDASEVVRVRMEEGVPTLNPSDYSAVIVGGGPWNVSDPEEKKPETQKNAEAILFPFLRELVTRDIPLMGACYGLGALVTAVGGRVSKEQFGEPVGGVDIHLTKEGQMDPLLTDLPSPFRALVGHKEAVQCVPEGAVLLASSPACPVHLIRFGRHVYATQFHPELDVEGICLRTDIYKNAGYFAPEDAEKIKAELRKEHVDIPMLIMKRFVELVREHVSVKR